MGKHAMETQAQSAGWVTVPRCIDSTELWSNIMGSGFETWDWWLAVSYAEDTDWNVPGKVTLSIADPAKERGGLIGTLDLQDMVDAIDKLAMDGTALNVDDLDAHTGDLILQVAMLGEVVCG